MAFKHKDKKYPPLPFDNPFQEGQDRAYADLLQEAIKDKNFWQRIVGGAVTFLFVVFIGCFIYYAKLQKTVPVLVNVMPSGESQYLGEVRQTGSIRVPESAIQWQIRHFITLLRSVSIDPQVLYQNIDQCYSMVTGSYEPEMTRDLRASNPFDMLGKRRRTVNIETVLKITANSYQVDWTEALYDSASSQPEQSRYRALITIRLIQPTEETIRKNPLGIYIENMEKTSL